LDKQTKSLFPDLLTEVILHGELFGKLDNGNHKMQANMQEKCNLCEHLLTKKDLFPKIIIRDVTHSLDLAIFDIWLLAPLLNFADFERLIKECGIKEHTDLFTTYLAKIHSILSADDKGMKSEPVLANPLTNRNENMAIPDDIWCIIIAHSDVFDLLYVCPLVCSYFKRTITISFILNHSNEYSKFIVERSNTILPQRLFCLKPVNALFDSVHDLVCYRFKHGPVNVHSPWFMFIHRRIDGFREHPDLILASAKSYREKYGKLNIDYSVPLDDLVELFDVLLLDDDKFAIELCTDPNVNTRRLILLTLIKRCNNGASLLRQAIDRIFHYQQLALFESEASLGVEKSKVLREYAASLLGAGKLSLPLTADAVRRTVTIMSEVHHVAHIVKAFAEVDFNGLNFAEFKGDVHQLVLYLVCHPKLLTREQFASFLVWLKEHKMVCWEDGVDSKCVCFEVQLIPFPD
jgi:hypothetical protein